MEKELLESLCEQYEVNKEAVMDIAKILSESEVVNESNFETILETAVSHYSSSRPLEYEFNLPGRGKPSKEKSSEYALNLEVFNSDYYDEAGKTR